MIIANIPDGAGMLVQGPVGRRQWLAALAAMPGLRAGAAGSAAPRLLAGLVPSINEPGGPVERQVRGVLSEGWAEQMAWLPWPRAHAMAERGNALLFPLARTPGREARWQWLVRLLQDRLVLVLPPAHRRKGVETSSFRALTVGLVRSSFVADRLESLGLRHMEFAPSELSNARKLGLGRIDLWATMETIARAPEQAAWLPAGSTLLPLGPEPFSAWLAASRDVPAATLGRLLLSRGPTP